MPYYKKHGIEKHDLERTSVTQDHWIFIVAQLEKKNKKPMRPGQLDQHSATKIDSCSFTCLLDLETPPRCSLLLTTLLQTCISKPLLCIFQFIQNLKPASLSPVLLPRMISWRSAGRRASVSPAGGRRRHPQPPESTSTDPQVVRFRPFASVWRTILRRCTSVIDLLRPTTWPAPPLLSRRMDRVVRQGTGGSALSNLPFHHPTPPVL